MELYMKRCREPGEGLFRVYDRSGDEVYSVSGDTGSLGGRIYLRDTLGEEVARILRIGPPGLCRYRVAAGDRSLRMICNMAAPSLRIMGAGWRVRGDLLLRSFDVTAGGSIIMSHGRCWCSVGDCFALDIPREEDVPVCIAIAVVVDIHGDGISGAALPVG